MKVLLGVMALSLMVSFLSIGYATVTDNLRISGRAEIQIPSGLFITDIKHISSSGLDVSDASYTEYSTTVTCSLSKRNSNQAGSITYEITVLNNTTYEYAYRDLYFQSSLKDFNNDLIQKKNADDKIGVVTSFPEGTKVAPGKYMKFRVTYTLGSSWSLSSGKTYKTLINYQFGINVESELEAVNAVHAKFLDILNTPSTYETLVDVLDNKFDGRQEWTSNYVGNVGSATSDDAMAVNTLFAGQLQLIINGQTRPATVLIKHENLDNNQKTGDDYVARNNSNGGVFRGYGCEMTLYLTTDPLNKANGRAPVYVSVFTCDRDDNGNISGKWYLIGETYLGNANIVGYNGESGGTGSFVTDNWVSNAGTYRVTDNYSYSVAAGETIKNLVQTVDRRMINEFQSLLYEAKAMIEDRTYAGTGIRVVEEAYERASRYYNLDENGNPVAIANLTRAQLCPIVRQLETNLQVAKDKIEEITGRQ